MIQELNEKVEFIVVSTAYRTTIKQKKTAQGIEIKEDSKFIKHLRVAHLFNKEDCLVTQYITRDNLIAKKRAVVFNRATNAYYTVAHSYEEVKRVLTEKNKPSIGFKR